MDVTVTIPDDKVPILLPEVAGSPAADQKAAVKEWLTGQARKVIWRAERQTAGADAEAAVPNPIPE